MPEDGCILAAANSGNGLGPICPAAVPFLSIQDREFNFPLASSVGDSSLWFNDRRFVTMVNGFLSPTMRKEGEKIEKREKVPSLIHFVTIFTWLRQETINQSSADFSIFEF